MSKIPPQRTKTLHNTFYLFGICHKIVYFCNYFFEAIPAIRFNLLLFRLLRQAQDDKIIKGFPLLSGLIMQQSSKL